MDFDTKGLAFPLRLGPGRSLAVVGIEEDVSAMLEQILLTSPGERVNRPTFGVGVLDYVFEPASSSIATRIRIALEQNVYEHLGASVKILGVDAEVNEVELHVHVQFSLRGTLSGPQDLDVTVPIGSAP